MLIMKGLGLKFMNKKHFISAVIATALFVYGGAGWAQALSSGQAPSSAQIEMFKQLPASQQEALAKQYGIDLGALKNNGNAQPNINQEDISNDRRPISDRDSYSYSDDEELQDLMLGLNPLFDLLEEEPAVLEPFGYELFKNAPTSFMPAVDIPIPSEYIMGPGDNIIVQLYGKENASHALTINREGEIQFPNLGPVVVAGLNFTEVKALIADTIEEQMIGVRASVTMGALRSIRIFILGAAELPGSYTVNSLSTMTNALFASGGISEMGSLRNIQLKRGGQLITRLDLYDLLLKGDTSGDARLLPGDVIFVPHIGKTVGVKGEVRRPAIYELNAEKTSQEVIALAGGFLPTAYPQASRIERINDRGDRTLVDVNLKSQQGKNALIKDADIIDVVSVLDTVENVVLIEGHVKRPGGLAWRKGLYFSDTVQGASALLPNPDLNAALLIRELQPTRQLEVEFINPGKAFANPHSSDDPLLGARDRIIIFDYSTDRIEILEEIVESIGVQANQYQRRQLASVNGNVRFPGEYPLPVNASAGDLIALAGGLTDRAFSLGVEVTRYVLDAEQQQSIQHTNIDLSNSGSYILAAEDSLHIRQLPNWKGTETIEVTGEVVFPGTYTIQRGETLSQVINRAGGLNEYAFVEASIFSRKELRQLEDLRLEELQQKLESDIAASNVQESSSVVEQEEAEQLIESMEGIRPTGRMVIDLAKIIEQPESYDVILKDGDSLVVPMQRQTVTIVGEVQHATSHVYEARLSMSEYIERSGGITNQADKKRIYVVRANGSVYLPNESHWFKRGDKDIQPGDTVVVPLDAERMKKLTLWGSVSEIVYRMALGAAAVASF